MDVICGDKCSRSVGYNATASLVSVLTVASAFTNVCILIGHFSFQTFYRQSTKKNRFLVLWCRIPLKKFRSIRRELTDSGRNAEELVASKQSLKYNLGFPSSSAPTPETLKNYLDVGFPRTNTFYAVFDCKDWSCASTTTEVHNLTVSCFRVFFWSDFFTLPSAFTSATLQIPQSL